MLKKKKALGGTAEIKKATKQITLTDEQVEEIKTAIMAEGVTNFEGMTLSHLNSILDTFEEYDVEYKEGGGNFIPPPFDVWTKENNLLLQCTLVEPSEGHNIGLYSTKDEKTGKYNARLFIPATVDTENGVITDNCPFPFTVNLPKEQASTLGIGDMFDAKCVEYAKKTKKLIAFNSVIEL